jgi:hypothetical protein
MNKILFLSIFFALGISGASSAQKLFIGACADAFLLHVQNTSMHGIADARSKVGFSGGMDIYCQMENTLILGAGYNVEKIAMYDDVMTYNIAVPAHTVYMILGTGIVRNNLFVNFLGKLGYTVAPKPKDNGPNLHEYNYKTKDDISGGFKVNVGRFITPKLAASIQAGLYYYPFQISYNKMVYRSSFFTVPFGISLNYVISH